MILKNRQNKGILAPAAKGGASASKGIFTVFENHRQKIKKTQTRHFG